MILDGRLLVVAGAAWLGAASTQAGLDRVEPLASRHGAAVTALACGGVLALGAATFLLASASRRSGRRVALGVVGLLAAIGSLSGSWQVSASTGWPLAGWTDARVTATIDGLVTGEPEQRRPSVTQSWQSNWLDVRLATSRITARGQTVDVGIPMIVRTSEAAVVPPPGSRVRVVGRLSSAPTLSAAAVVTATSAQPFVVVTGPGPVDAAAHAMRRALRSAVAGVPSDAGALVAGLATGDDSLQSAELAADMRASGLSHLTAVSGGNVAVILALVLGLAASLRLSLVIRVVAALLALGGFVVLVGPQPSVLRAAVMGGVVVTALLAGGRRNGPSLLATAVVLLVLTNPPLALSWGFALSVFATGGLILLAPSIDARLTDARLTGRWPPALRRAVALTVAAQIATLPLLVAMGSVVGWVSLPANLLAMPAVAPVTIAGLGTAVVGPLQPAVAEWLAHIAAAPAAWIAWVAHSCVRLPFASLPWPAGPVGAVACVAVIALAVGGAAAWRRVGPRGIAARTKLIGAVALVPVLLLWLVAPPGRRAWPPDGWFLIMCDVGQGDALLLRDGSESAVLVDAGPDPQAVDRCLLDARVATVSAIVLTHFHADHVDGLPGVLRGRSVGPVLVNPIRDPDDKAADVDAVLESAGHRSAEAISAGDHRRVGDVEWVALWPRRRIDAGSVPNNASIVLAVNIAGHQVLLTGDIEPEAQAAIGEAFLHYRFDVVKVPHHGSRYQSPQLPVWASAPIALVSVGADNDYGHPAAETIASWEAVGAVVARTDLDGDVAVVSVPGSSQAGIARH